MEARSLWIGTFVTKTSIALHHLKQAHTYALVVMKAPTYDILYQNNVIDQAPYSGLVLFEL
jgi:hypothetical protein